MFLNCKNIFRFFVQVGNELSYLALFCFLVLSRARVFIVPSRPARKPGHGFCYALIIIWHLLNVCDVVLVLCAYSSWHLLNVCDVVLVLCAPSLKFTSTLSRIKYPGSTLSRIKYPGSTLSRIKYSANGISQGSILSPSCFPL